MKRVFLAETMNNEGLVALKRKKYFTYIIIEKHQAEWLGISLKLGEVAKVTVDVHKLGNTSSKFQREESEDE